MEGFDINLLAIMKGNSLFNCVKSLGFVLGWRYWRLSQRAAKNPKIVLQWARDCRKKALTFEQDSPDSKAFISWAEELEARYEIWKIIH